MNAAAAMPDPPDEVLRCRFPATQAAVSTQLTHLHAAFARHGLNDTLRNDVTIVLGEVLNNIVEHALRDVDGAWVMLEVTREDGRLHIETVDRGSALPPALLATADQPTVDVSVGDLPEGGFGWFIIHSLTEDMVYERDGGTNRLSFSFPEGPGMAGTAPIS